MFSNLIFFNVVLNESICIFAFCPSLSPSVSFPMLLIHSDFLLCSLGCHIYSRIVWLLLHLGVGMFSCNPPLHAGRIISLDIFSLSSFTSTFWFISSNFIVTFSCVAFSFLSQRIPTFPFVLSLLLVLDFLSAFLFKCPIHILIFCSCSLKGPRFFNKLISLLNRLVYLVWWRFFYMY